MASSAVATPPSWRRSFRRFVRRWAILLGFGYLLICLIMWLLENSLVFRPTTSAQAWEPAPTKAIQDVELQTASGFKIHAWWLANASSDRALLLCPGNGGNLSGRGTTLVKIADRLNTSILIFDYPGYGKSEGKPNEQRCYEAAEAALAWLNEEKKISSERVVLYGESLGGGVATELAIRHECKALVLVKTFTSLPATAKRHYPWLPCYWLMSNRFDNISKLPRVHCPVFIVSASDDSVVPFEHGEELFKIANEPKRFFRDEGSDHGDPLSEQFWVELRAFLDSH